MMSPNKTKKGAVAIRDPSPEPGPSTSGSTKRQRSKMSSDDEEDSVSRKGASKASKYGSHHMRSPSFSSHNRPAELFRKDLISAMKLADSDQLQEGTYFLISDPWRQEWEKGVQVPVNMEEVNEVDVKEIREKIKNGDFKIPHKLLHEKADTTYKKGLHELSGMPQLTEQLVRYDLDDLDVCWLEEVNDSLQELGLEQITEWNMERVMEALETQCHEKMMAIKKTEEGLGIEYDEDVVCDVCRSPDSEDTNEMVFCDGCDVCIHQACYGIQSIPEGTWLCRTCALGIKPRCLLCPQTGGAMKSTRSGTKWAHVSCALWIPEVSIGIPEKMEPVCKISNIPASRWALVCCLCKERVGACIQCSVKTCKTAFHVTCGFQNGLEMKTILDEADEEDGIKLKAYCPKHTKKRERGHSESDTDSPRKEGAVAPKKELTKQEKANLRVKRLEELEEDFFTAVDIREVVDSLKLDEEIVNLVYVYWKLKRKCNWGRPLLTPKTEEADILEKQQEDSLVARMKMFVHLRQDLERVRNLCYMIGKREKMKRQFFRCKEFVFSSMVRVLLDKQLDLSNSDVEDIIANYQFDSVYNDYGLSVPGGILADSQIEESYSMMLDDCSLKASAAEDSADDVDIVESMHRSLTHDKDISTADSTAVTDEESIKMLSRGERWSGDFVRSGFFKRRRHRKWTKSPGSPVKKSKIGKDTENYASTCVSGSKSELIETEVTTDVEDSVFAQSADEFEVEIEKPYQSTEKHTAPNYSESAESLSSLQPPILRLIVKSPNGRDYFSRRHKHRHKKHRGRKPWHVKKSHNSDLQAKIEIVSDDEDAARGTSAGANFSSDVAESLVDTQRNVQNVDNSLKLENLQSKKGYENEIDDIILEIECKTSSPADISLQDRSLSEEKTHISENATSLVDDSKEDDDINIETDYSSPNNSQEIEPDTIKLGELKFEKEKKETLEDVPRRESRSGTIVFEPFCASQSAAGHRFHRKSSQQTRLKMNEALSALAESSDDDFEQKQPVVAAFTKRSKLTKRSSSRHHKRDINSDGDNSVEEGKNEKVENQRQSRHRHSNGLPKTSHQVQSKMKSAPRLPATNIRPELNVLLQKAKLTVKDSLKEKVQNRLLKSCKKWRTASNGHLDTNQQRIDTFFGKPPVGSEKSYDSADSLGKHFDKKQSSNRVLHEITPERGWNHIIFGAHYTPKGSLSGYKIPKKSSNQTASLTTPVSPLHSAPPTVQGSLSCRRDRHSLKSEASSGSPGRKLCMDNMPLAAKSVFGSAVSGQEPASATAVISSQCDTSRVSPETIANHHSYRSHSPQSVEHHSDSRESTPRRMTRSQIIDDMVENAPSPQSGGIVGGGGSLKTRLRDSWLKAAHFST